MRLEEPKNKNYCATIVALKEFVPIPNADRIKSAIIFGNSVIVSKDTKEGEIGLFFPVETQLSHEFTSANNLYRHNEMGNVDPTKTGYLEIHRRIKCVKFLGVKSEGYWIGIHSLAFIDKNIDLPEGTVFDVLNGIEICKKYIPKHNPAATRNKSKVGRLMDQIVDGQFRFHFDTENLRKNIHKINPTDYISITDKWHGTSAIVGKIMVKRTLPWYEKVLRKLGVKIQETTYGVTHSSRRVIKGINGIEKNTRNFYDEDIYGTVAKEIGDKIPASYTVYGEIVGYTSTGSHIQAASGGRPYHYGCEVGKHDFRVYRIITTNIDGKTLELSFPQMKEFCTKYGLKMVYELFYGPVTQFYGLFDYLEPNEIDPPNMIFMEWDEKRWHTGLLKKLETTYVHDQMCEFNNETVPAEGVVVRVDRLTECESWKLKNFKFLEDETKKNDTGEADMETLESIQDEG